MAWTYLTVTGAINGTNTVFTLSPNLSSLELFHNGALQSPGGDYTRAGATVTFLFAPFPGDALLAVGE